MPNDPFADEPTVVATYANRHNAEIAQGVLEEENIQSLIVADDAGGTHPQLQLTQSVRLTVRQEDAAEARTALEATNVLSTPHEPETDLDFEGPSAWRSLGAALAVMGLATLAVGVVVEMPAIIGVGTALGIVGGVLWWIAAGR